MRRPVRRFGLLIVLGWLLAGAIFWAGVAKAAPLPAGCAQQLWWYGSAARATTRTLCDGPILADGSWVRARNFFAPERYVPMSCSWTYYGGGCSGGYWLPVFDTGVERYPVTPESVLADEPGHLA